MDGLGTAACQVDLTRPEPPAFHPAGPAPFILPQHATPCPRSPPISAPAPAPSPFPHLRSLSPCPPLLRSPGLSHLNVPARMYCDAVTMASTKPLRACGRVVVGVKGRGAGEAR